MPTGNDCPACGENIGIGAVFKAPVPNRIYCPHCGERLRYGETWGLIVAAVFALNAVIVAATAGSSNDSWAITWHQWQAEYPTDSRIGTSRCSAAAKASDPHGYQSTGLSRC